MTSSMGLDGDLFRVLSMGKAAQVKCKPQALTLARSGQIRSRFITMNEYRVDGSNFVYESGPTVPDDTSTQQ
jgi:hypothetical protein